MNVSTEEKILIDKLVHTNNRNEIMDIVKKLVPAATEFTAMLFADYSEYPNDYFIDEFMDRQLPATKVASLRSETPNCLDTADLLQTFQSE